MLIFVIARLSSSLRTRTQLGFLNHYASHISHSFSSASKLSQSYVPEQPRDGNHSFAVSYLMNSCGFSAKVANEVSKRVELKDSDKPDSIINLLRSYDFSDAQISKIVTCYPRLLCANPDHNLLPRLRFLQSIGFSASEIPELISYNPALLLYSLEKRIIPHYEALKGVLGDDWRVRRCFKRSRWQVFSYNVRNIIPNLKVLRDEGVPESLIFSLLSNNADVAFTNQSKLVECVNFVKEIGIKPDKAAFVEALVVVTFLSKSTWELKLDIFERLGWSRDVTLLAFSKAPRIMAMSEKKITDTMKFFADEMGLRLEDVARCLSLLGYSLKNRIAPRWSVVKILKMKGLIKDNLSLPYAIITSEKLFLKNFVIKFQKCVPQLQKLYSQRGELEPLPDVRA